MLDGIRTLDIIVLLLYFIAIAAAGVWFARRNKTTEDYFLGGRNFPSWAIGLSMVGTSISSISFLAYPGDAYKTAYLRLLPAFMLPIGILAASYFFLPFFRRGKVTSAFEYLEGRYGPSTRVYASSMFIIAQLVRVATILFLVSLLVNEFTGLSLGWCVVLGGIFVAFYTVLGGIEAVVWTDVAQTLVLIFGGILCLAVIVYDVPGGLSEIISRAMEAGKLSFSEFNTDTNEFEPSRWDFSLYEKTAGMMLVIGLSNWFYEYSCNQNVVQRYCASRSAKDARKAMWLCCWTSIPLWSFFMFLGTAMWVFFQEFPTEASQQMLSGEMSESQILPHFVLTELPPGLGGLVVAAVLAAAMSSLDSSINAISTVGVVDLYRRHVAPDKTDLHYLRVARLFAVMVGVIMVLGGLLFVYFQNIGQIDTLQDASTILTQLTAGGLLGMYMLGFFTTRGDARAIGVGIVFTLIWTLYRTLDGMGTFGEPGLIPAIDAIDTYYTGIIGHLVMFLAGFGMASLFTRRERDLTNLTVWTQDGTPLD